MLSIAVRAEKARESAVVFNHENLRVVEFKGKDTVDFLNRMGTAKVKGREIDSVFQTLFLKGDGRLLGEMVLRVVSPERIIGFVDVTVAEGLIETLDRFLFTEDVEITLLQNRRVFVVYGDKAADVANEAMETAVEGIGKAQTGPRGSVLTVAKCPGVAFVYVATAEDNLADVRTRLYQAVQTAEGVIGEDELFETLRIENGIPKFGAELSEKVIPLEAGLKEAIDFAKGCFPGQEVVARIENLGHPANVLVGVQLAVSDHGLEGAILESVEGKKLGAVTSRCYSPLLKTGLALGYVKWDFREPGTVVKVRFADESVADGVVVGLPLR